MKRQESGGVLPWLLLVVPVLWLGALTATGYEDGMTLFDLILGWGIVQVGMSFQSHDASQRTQGFLCLFGGLLIAFCKEILTAIGAV